MLMARKKYRPSPSASANLYCGKSKRGNDGRMYISKRTIRGYCQWKLKTSSNSRRRRSSKKQYRRRGSSSKKQKLYTSATINLGHSYSYAKKTEKFKKPIPRSTARNRMKKYCTVDCYMEDDHSQGSRLIIDTGS